MAQAISDGAQPQQEPHPAEFDHEEDENNQRARCTFQRGYQVPAFGD